MPWNSFSFSATPNWASTLAHVHFDALEEDTEEVGAVSIVAAVCDFRNSMAGIWELSADSLVSKWNRARIREVPRTTIIVHPMKTTVHTDAIPMSMPSVPACVRMIQM